jgi:hypothetical protein
MRLLVLFATKWNAPLSSSRLVITHGGSAATSLRFPEYPHSYRSVYDETTAHERIDPDPN